jgi:hypothetical protein
MKKPSLLRKVLVAGMLVAIPAAAMSAMVAEQPTHIRGVVTGVSATGFTVQTDAGMKTIVLVAGTRITGVVPSSIDAIQPGSFIGSANLTNGTMSRAQEVVVFPPAMKGSGLGDYPWDLPAQGGGISAMTNGNVMSSAMTNGAVKSSEMGDSSMMRSAMTNGTVKTASGSGSRTIVVDYGKGEKTIEVMANTPVVTFKPSDKSAIVKGAHVFVAGKPGTPVTAAIVAVGLDGTVPPM